MINCGAWQRWHVWGAPSSVGFCCRHRDRFLALLRPAANAKYIPRATTGPYFRDCPFLAPWRLFCRSVTQLSGKQGSRRSHDFYQRLGQDGWLPCVVLGFFVSFVAQVTRRVWWERAKGAHDDLFTAQKFSFLIGWRFPKNVPLTSPSSSANNEPSLYLLGESSSSTSIYKQRRKLNFRDSFFFFVFVDSCRFLRKKSVSLLACHLNFLIWFVWIFCCENLIEILFELFVTRLFAIWMILCSDSLKNNVRKSCFNLLCNQSFQYFRFLHSLNHPARQLKFKLFKLKLLSLLSASFSQFSLHMTF